MVISFEKKLQKALEEISFTGEFYEFMVHEDNFIIEHSEELINRYGQAKWSVVDILNERFNHILNDNELHNSDDLYYYLNDSWLSIQNMGNI